MTIDQINDIYLDLIIPVYKPDDKLYRLLGRINKQTIRPRNILILHTVENINNPSPLPIPKNMDISTKVFYVDKNDYDHGATRGYGASLSEADILMYMTQDAVPVDDYLIENLLEPYKNKEVAASYARQLADSKAGIIEAYTRSFNYPNESLIKSAKDIKTLGIKAFFCSNVCATYRRDVYETLGGFVKKTIFNEDMIMAHTMICAGYKIAYQAKAKVIHSHKYSYLQQFSRNFDLGVSHRQYGRVFLGVSSESEGIRLLKSSIRYLINKKKYLLIPDLILSSGLKYLGYKLGVNYNKLPKSFVVHWSMNKGYWRDGAK